MLEDLQEILNYFPIESVDFNAGSGDQYLQDLSKVIEDNHKSGNYQVAFFNTHLLFMSYVYYAVTKAYKVLPDRVRDVYFPINSYFRKEDKPDFETYVSIYEFSKIPEKEIFKVFYALDLDESYIKGMAKYIEDRDDYAHATGKGNITEEQLQNEIRNIKGNMRAIENLFHKNLLEGYKSFLLEFYSHSFQEVQEIISDIIFLNEFSINDLTFLCGIGISHFRDENEEIKENYRNVKNLHCAFYAYCIENYNFDSNECYDEWTKKDYYLEYRYKDEADSYIEDILNISKYDSASDGGDFPLYECPNCDEEQLVYIEEKEIYKCFHCGYQWEERELTHCSECGKLFETGDDIICSSCWERKTEEDC